MPSRRSCRFVQSNAYWHFLYTSWSSHIWVAFRVFFFFVATDIIENTMNFTYTGGSRIHLATKGDKTDRSYDKLQRLM